MNWEALGAIGEIAGAIGVILSLFYVAFQVKQNSKLTTQNTNAIENSAWDSTIRSINDVRLQIASSAELATIWNSGMAAPHELNADDLERFRLLVASVIDATSMQYEQYTKLGMDSDYWKTTTQTLIRFASTPGFIWYWDNFSKETPDKFQVMLNDLIEKNRANET